MIDNMCKITEKWRTCRRARALTKVQMTAAIITIVYVGVYAEAQRREGNVKEFGAALAALVFIVTQLIRAVMGRMRLNAFVAWCGDAAKCIQALEGRDYQDSSSASSEVRGRDETRNMTEMVQQGQNVDMGENDRDGTEEPWVRCSKRMERTLL